MTVSQGGDTTTQRWSYIFLQYYSPPHELFASRPCSTTRWNDDPHTVCKMSSNLNAYESWTVVALKAELGKRNVPLKGLTKKAQYVARLRELDGDASRPDQLEKSSTTITHASVTKARDENPVSRESTPGFETVCMPSVAVPLQQPATTTTDDEIKSSQSMTVRADANTTSSHPFPADGDDSDYGMSSCDEAELEFVASQVESSPHKRSIEAVDSTPAKRQRLPPGPLNTNQALKATGHAIEMVKLLVSSFPLPSSQNIYSSQQSYIPGSGAQDASFSAAGNGQSFHSSQNFAVTPQASFSRQSISNIVAKATPWLYCPK